MSKLQQNDEITTPSTLHVDPNPDETGRASPALASTNYGNQVAYNYGSISNYFCHNVNALHHCDFTHPNLDPNSSESPSLANLKKAQELLVAERWTDAKVLFYEVLHSQDNKIDDGARATVRYSLGHAHYALAEFSDAITNLQTVAEWVDQQDGVTASGDILASRYWLGRSLFHVKEYENASLQLQSFVFSQDERPCSNAQDVTSAHLWLGLTFERLQYYEAAKDQLQTAWSLNENEHGAEHLETLACRHHLANFCFKREEYSDAKEHFLWLLQVEERLTGPERYQSIITRSMLAFCICELGDLQAAEPHLQRLLNRMESQEYFTMGEGRDLGLTRYWSGRVLILRDHFEPAHWMFQRALMFLRNFDDLSDKFLDCEFYLGMSLVHLRQSAGAEQVLSHVLKESKSLQRGDVVAVTYWLVESLLQQNKFDEAQSLLSPILVTSTMLQTAKWNRDDITGCFRLVGELHFHREEFQKAKDVFQQLVDAEPCKPNEDSNYCRLWLARIFFDLRQFSQARDHLQIAHDAAQQNPEIRENKFDIELWLAWSLAELDNYQDAETHLRGLLLNFAEEQHRPTPKLDFILGRSKYYLGRISIHRWDVTEAAKCFQEALAMLERVCGPTNPFHILCRYHLARCLLGMQRNSEAQGFLQGLVDLQNENPAIRTVCQTLVPYRLACVQMRRSQYSAARQNISRCIQNWDSTTATTELPLSTVQYDQAYCDYHLRQFESSIETLQIVYNGIDWEDVEQKKKYQPVLSLLGRSLYFSQRFVEACPHLESHLAFLQTSVGHDSGSVACHKAYLADAYCELGRFKEAQPLLRHSAYILDALPDTQQGFNKATGKYWLGRQAFDRRRYTEAEVSLQEAIRLLGARDLPQVQQKRHNCRHFLARTFSESAKYAEAEAIFQELVARPFQTSFASQAADNYYYLGCAYHNQQRYSEAKTAYVTAISEPISAKLVQQFVPTCQMRIGLALYYQNRYTEAKSHFEKAVNSTEPYDFRSDTRRWVGHCEFYSGNLEAALQIFQSLVDEGNQNASKRINHRYLLGRVLDRLGRSTEAQEYLASALQDSSKEWEYGQECHYLIGSFQFSSKNYREAVKHALLAKKAKDAKIPSITLNIETLLARCHLALGHPKQAYKVFQDFFSGKTPRTLFPVVDYKRARFHFAKCLIRLHKSAEAQNELESLLPFFSNRVKAKDGTIVEVQYALADLLYSRQQYERAAGLFQEALANFDVLGVDSDFDVWRCRMVLGNAFRYLLRYDEALALHQQVFDYAHVNGDDLLRVGSRKNLLESLSRAGKHKEALLMAQEDLARHKTNNLAALHQRVKVADIAFEMQDWPLTAEIRDKCAVQLNQLPDGFVEHITFDRVEFYSRYSHALKKLERYDESQNMGLQAMNLRKSEKVIEGLDDHSYKKLMAYCMDLDSPSSLDHGKKLDCASTASNSRTIFVQPLASFTEGVDAREVFGDEDHSSQSAEQSELADANTPPKSEEQKCTFSRTETSKATVQSERVSNTSATPAPLRSKPPKPPRPPKPPTLEIRIRKLAAERDSKEVLESFCST